MTPKPWYRSAAQRLRNIGSGRAGTSATATEVLDRYVTTFPCAQNAIDAIPGWSHAFPPSLGLKAGEAHLYQDDRVQWCLEQFGSVAGRSILELGPLEGMHTYMLAQAGAGHIDAIEANELAFLRCLITREILGIANASFLLGDFNRWMEDGGRRYDLVVASGVLYHAADPLHLLDLIARSADAFFLWTHYFDDEAMPAGDLRRVPFSGHVERRDMLGRSVELYERSYYQAWRDPKFCGGLQDRHFWMTKPGILDVVEALGFTAAIGHDQPGHTNGPSFCLFARRRGS